MNEYVETQTVKWFIKDTQTFENAHYGGREYVGTDANWQYNMNKGNDRVGREDI